MFIPIPFTNPRKWMDIRIRAVERRWFDEFGKFSTYTLKNVIIEDIVDEDELVWMIVKTLRDNEIHLSDDIEKKLVEVCGIAEEYIGLILERVRNEMKELKREVEEVELVENKLDPKTYQKLLEEVQKLYIIENFERETIIKAISLQFGLKEHEAREIVSAVELLIFSL